MKNKFINIILILFLLNGCVGASSKGVFGTGVSVALDPRTVGTHLYNIKQKLNAKNQAELAIIAVQSGLIEP